MFMKKLLFLLILFCISFVTHAQTLILGARAGINYSNVTFSGQNGVFRPAYKIGWHAGVVGLMPVNERLAFKPEVVYSLKGYRGEGTNTDGFRRLTLNYIDVPLLAEFRFGKIILDMGPQLSYLFRAGRVVRQDGEDRYREQNEFYSRFDAGYVLGLAFRLDERSRVGVRYSGGIIPIDRGIDPDRSYTNARNQVIQLTATFLFRERFN
jgi:hypothetical protein